MKIKELREKNLGELKRLLAEKSEQVRKVRFDLASKQIKNTKEMKNTRRDIARIMTLIREQKN